MYILLISSGDFNGLDKKMRSTKWYLTTEENAEEAINFVEVDRQDMALNIQTQGSEVPGIFRYSD